MWYHVDLRVKQNENFYSQVDSVNQKIVETNCRNRIDRTEYIFKGDLGCIFKSIESKEPKLTSNNFRRYIFDIEFYPYFIKKIGFRKYEISWVSTELSSYEDIASFYYEYLLKQVPSGTDLECLKKCLKSKTS